ncbi:YidC/Oxa1 family membrane protein insertase [Polymorphospora rubra]|uniref:Membrane protein insertase YidC n=1 Tax=Polymorphospora rubra TaxID=338584 RepID=A0A810MZN7_9ACTN|nr:membrane protein insertase YidC [Polymorphospora rubra]BCJ66597.1 protein translocase component YidC [Polymorphospora rubra]
MLAFAPLDGAVSAASTAVSALAQLVAPLAGDASTAAAIVLFTIVVRLLISPLSWAQVRGERRRTALAPQVRELQRKHAGDPARMQAELVDLYRTAGASPLAGCLPALLQAPFFFVMYRLFTTSDPDSGLLAERLAGVPLGHHVADGIDGAAGPLFAVLFAALLVLAWWSSRRMRRTAALAAAAGAEVAAPAKAGAKASEPQAEVTAMLGRIMPLLPYGTLLVAAVVPLAAVLYLVATTAWTALEHVVLRRPQPAPLPDPLPGR